MQAQKAPRTFFPLHLQRLQCSNFQVPAATTGVTTQMPKTTAHLSQVHAIIAPVQFLTHALQRLHLRPASSSNSLIFLLGSCLCFWIQNLSNEVLLRFLAGRMPLLGWQRLTFRQNLSCALLQNGCHTTNSSMAVLHASF